MKNERLHENMQPTFPPKDIICKDCVFKLKGVLGYRNATCEMYEQKPHEVLFEKEWCGFYERE